MAKLLHPLVVPAAHPERIIPDLERAIAGEAAFLPVPERDHARADVLRQSQRAGQPIDDRVALVMATSGSTGTPKGAELTPANLVSSADATHRRLGGEGQWLLALPAHHIAGLQVLIRSMIAGVEPVAVDVSGGFDVQTFAAASYELARTEERAYTSLVPMQLYKAMETLAGIEALRVFDAILVGGAALRPETRGQCEELGIRIVTTYGSSETAGGCVYDGVPLPGARVRLEGSRVWLGGPMIARGYRNAPGHEAFSRPGWFGTSDCGQVADGKLEIIGRLDAVIDSGGLKLHPEVLEQALMEQPGVTEACVVGVPDERLGQAIAAAYTGPASPTDVLSGLEDLPRWQLPRRIRQVAELPKSGSGMDKVDRRAVIRLLSS